MSKLLWISLYTLRLLNALACQTFFQPDEFFQSLEVAHRLVFGFGWQTWEWRSQSAIRSPLHALLFVPAYWIVKLTGTESTVLLVRRGYKRQGWGGSVEVFARPAEDVSLRSMTKQDLGSESHPSWYSSVQ